MKTDRKLNYMAFTATVLLVTVTACQPEIAAPTTAPTAPVNLFAYLTEEYRLSINWLDKSDDESGFILQRKDVMGGNTIEMGRPPTDATFFIDGSFDCAATYEYSVAAFNDAGMSEAACIQITLPENCRENRSVGLAPCGTVAEAPTEMPAGTPTGEIASITCGDGTCSAGEDAASCPADCGSIAAPTTESPICGDGSCNGSETALSCAADCMSLPPLNPGLFGPSCGDGTCDSGESFINCPADCRINISPPHDFSYCGNGICDMDENMSNCDADCGYIDIAP